MKKKKINKKYKKGFTLIELLAVIVILAIIALIATPIVMNLIGKARKSAAEDSAYGILKTAENYYAMSLLDDPVDNKGVEFTCGSVSAPTICSAANGEKLEFNGTSPTSGKIKVTNNGDILILEDLVINGYECNYKEEGSTEIACGKNNEDEKDDNIGATRVLPTGNETYKAIVYLDPTNLSTPCDASNTISTTETKSGCMKFYAYAETDTTYDLILDHNTTIHISYDKTGTNEDGPKELLEQLHTDTDHWVGIDYRNDSYSINNGTANFEIDYSTYRAKIISAEEIATLVNSDWDATTATDSSYYFDSQFGTSNADNCKWSSDPASNYANCKYGWLNERLKDCEFYGCANPADEIMTAYSYWTITPVAGQKYQAWHVYNTPQISTDGIFNDDYRGVRPVITIPKSLFK